jgi:hypothetical protein
MLVPMVDMLNHDSENPNVGWKWHVGDKKGVDEGKGDIAVTTLRDVKKGEELCKCYGKCYLLFSCPSLCCCAHQANDIVSNKQAGDHLGILPAAMALCQD